MSAALSCFKTRHRFISHWCLFISIIIMTQSIDKVNIHCCLILCGGLTVFSLTSLFFCCCHWTNAYKNLSKSMSICWQTSAMIPLNARSPKPYYYPADMNILGKYLALTFLWYGKKGRKKMYSWMCNVLVHGERKTFRGGVGKKSRKKCNEEIWFEFHFLGWKQKKVGYHLLLTASKYCSWPHKLWFRFLRVWEILIVSELTLDRWKFFISFSIKSVMIALVTLQSHPEKRKLFTMETICSPGRFKNQPLFCNFRYLFHFTLISRRCCGWINIPWLRSWEF